MVDARYCSERKGNEDKEIRGVEGRDFMYPHSRESMM
jgi:hypothetical protein